MPVIHPRSSWIEPAYPFSAPPSLPALWRAVVYHYPGTPTVRSATLAETISFVQRMHRTYLADPNRGYSLGYCYVIGTGGDIIEVRGLDRRNAANDGTDSITGVSNYNYYTVSVQFAVSGEAPATEAQLAAAVELHHHIERSVVRSLAVEGHGLKDSTPCPGAGIRGQLAELDRRIHPPATPLPLPDEETDDMKLCVNRNGGYWLYNGVSKAPVKYPDAAPSPAGDLRLKALLLDLKAQGWRMGPDVDGVPQPLVLPDWWLATFDAAPSG